MATLCALQAGVAEAFMIELSPEPGRSCAVTIPRAAVAVACSVGDNHFMPRTDPFLFPGEREIVPTRVPTGTVTSRARKGDRNGTIYGLSCSCHPDDGIRYIGQTKSEDPHERFRRHLSVSAAGTNLWQAVYEWIPEHGAENIVFTVIESGIPADQLDYREYGHIRGLRGAGNKLMNQDDFWWVDAGGVWQHTWPDWAPFNDDVVISRAFVKIEFDRGIYPLTFAEFAALFGGIERQTVAGLADLLTPEGKARAAKWRHGLPTIEEVAIRELEFGPEHYGAMMDWARRVRSEHEFLPSDHWLSPL